MTLAATLFEADPAVFRENFDRAPFSFTHRLANHPLFEPDRLLRLAKDLARNPGDVYYDAGDVRVDQRWDEVGCDLPIDVLLHQIETAGAWIVLSRAEKDPEYAALLRRCLDEISERVGEDLGKVTKLQNAIVFLNSPHRITSYHIDRECNCLLQIRGSKTVSVFNRNDRTVLPEEEIERFWAADRNAPRYKPEYQDRATMYELTPGDGLHIPVNSPHWVQNGPEIAVSVSMNFHYRDEILGDIYRMNHLMRRFGMKPKPPHASPVGDNVKRALWRPIRVAKQVRRHLQGRAPSIYN
jgi:Cupin-like domain